VCLIVCDLEISKIRLLRPVFVCCAAGEQNKRMNVKRRIFGLNAWSLMGFYTGGNITTFKLDHPVFDCGIRWCMFPLCFSQNGVNFLRRLALQEKKKLDDSSRLDVVEIARVA